MHEMEIVRREKKNSNATALSTYPAPPQHILARWNVRWHVNVIPDCDSRGPVTSARTRVGAVLAVGHRCAHGRSRARAAGRGEVARSHGQRVSGPHRTRRVRSLRDVSTVDVLGAPVVPFQVLVTTEVQVNLVEAGLVEVRTLLAQPVRVASAMIGTDKPPYLCCRAPLPNGTAGLRRQRSAAGARRMGVCDLHMPPHAWRARAHSLLLSAGARLCIFA